MLETVASVHHHEAGTIERPLVSYRIAVEHLTTTNIGEDFVVLVRVHADKMARLDLSAVDPAVARREGQAWVEYFDTEALVEISAHPGCLYLDDGHGCLP